MRSKSQDVGDQLKQPGASVLRLFPTITPPSVVNQQASPREGRHGEEIELSVGCTRRATTRAVFGAPGHGGPGRLLACSVKEVIQPQVPLRLPCYDFAPVTTLAFGRLALLAQVPARTSGTRRFHGVTGGVYKARERIHRGVADPRLLAIPASCRRVADDNPN